MLRTGTAFNGRLQHVMSSSDLKYYKQESRVKTRLSLLDEKPHLT